LIPVVAQGLSHHCRNTNKKTRLAEPKRVIELNALAVFIKRPQAAISNRRRRYATPMPLGVKAILVMVANLWYGSVAEAAGLVWSRRIIF